MDTYTFVSKDKVFQWTVKREFLELVPNPEDVDAHDLMVHHHMQNFLHNENGPALKIVKKGGSEGYMEFWKNGEKVSK